MKGRRLRLDCLRLSIFLLFANICFGQQEIQVVDENKLGLPGVTIYYDGLAKISTDLEGKASIDFSEFKTLGLSYLGYDETYFTKAQIEKAKFMLVMKPSDQLIEEVLIVGRTNANSLDLPFQVETIDSKEIRLNQAQTSADAIEKTGSVYVQKSQMGGGSPILRGFEANKILLVVDGVRMNNAIYRSGHLQNAITIDPAILNRAELIYGPGSLLYGSDAIGGVIHFRTKNPLIDAEKFTGEAYARYASANNERSAHVNFSLSNQKNLAALSSLSISNFGDLRTGANRSDDYPDWGKRFEYVVRENDQDIIVQNEDPNIQVGTSYSQLDFLEKIIFQANSKLRVGLNMQYSISTDIPRYDFLSEYRNGQLRYAEWNYGPQARFLLSPYLEYNSSNKFFDMMMINSSYQRVNESREVRNFGSNLFTVQLEKLDIYGLNVDFRKTFPNNSLIEYGASFYFNDLSSTSVAQDIVTNEFDPNFLTRYPSGGSGMLQNGVYAHHRMDLIKDVLFWNAGLRWSLQTTNFIYNSTDAIVWPDNYYSGISNTNNSLVWMNGLNYRKNNWQIKFLAGSAYRAPNVDDLAKIRVKVDEITVPNPELIPEKTNNAEININYTNKNFKFGASAFYSSIRDIIVRRAFTLPDGSDTYISGPDTLAVTANVNAKQGKVRGLSGQFEYNATKALSVAASINYTLGTSLDETETESPLDHIPPLYGKAQIKYSKGNWENSLVMRYNGTKAIQDYGGTADNPEYALPEGTPSWQTFNLYTSYLLNNNWTFRLSLENILDTHYRTFASGLSAPGRNLILSVNYKW